MSYRRSHKVESTLVAAYRWQGIQQMTSSSGDITLVLRVNCATEVDRTSTSVDSILDGGHSQIITAVSKYAEAASSVHADPRFYAVLDHEVADGSLNDHLASSGLSPSRIVMCLGLARGVPYARLVATFLRLRGKRFIALGGGAPQPFGAAAFTQLMAITAWSTVIGLIGFGRVALERRGRLFWEANKPRLLRWMAGRSRSKCQPIQQIIHGRHIRRLLVIRLDRVGDLVMTLPALHSLNDYLGSKIEVDVLTTPYCAPVLNGQSDIEHVFLWMSSRPENDQGGHLTLSRRLLTLLKLRLRRYDVALDLRGDDEARELAVVCGARRRVGHLQSRIERTQSWAASLLTDPITIDDLGEPTYEYNVHFMEALGVPRRTIPYRLSVATAHRKAVQNKLGGLGISRRYAVVHARGSHAIRDWLPERFSALMDKLISQRNVDIVMTGSHADFDYNRLIIEKLSQHRGRVINAAGCFELSELGALYESAYVVVTLDTGPMHIAAAVGAPTVALFLPWQARRYRPFGPNVEVVVPSSPGVYADPDPILDTVPAGGDAISHLTAINVEDVIRAVNKVLEARSD